MAVLVCLAKRRQRPIITSVGEEATSFSPATREGRLTARPESVFGQVLPGLQCLGLDWPCDGLLYVPVCYRADRPAPLLLMLHGATSVGVFALWPIIAFADAAGLIVLAPGTKVGQPHIFVSHGTQD